MFRPAHAALLLASLFTGLRGTPFLLDLVSTAVMLCCCDYLQVRHGQGHDPQRGVRLSLVLRAAQAARRVRVRPLQLAL